MKSSGLIDFFFDPDATHSDMAFGKANVIVTLSDKMLTPKPSRGSRGGFFYAPCEIALRVSRIRVNRTTGNT